LKRLLLPLLVLSCAAACKRAPSFAPSEDFLAGTLPASVREGTPVRGGELRVRLWNEPSALNPYLAFEGFAWRVVEDRVFEKLLRFDRNAPDGAIRFAPALAESWELSADRRTYTFHLRQGVRWHDGKQFSSADVLATFQALASPRGPAAMRAYLGDIESFSAPDEKTFVARLARPHAMALEPFASNFIIMPAHLYDPKNPEATTTGQRPVGTGPWRFDRWDKGERIVLSRNDDYWGEKPWLDRVVYRIVKDDAVAWQLMQKGELDVVPRLTGEQYLAMAGEPAVASRFHRVRFFGRDYALLAWNTRHTPVGDARVRDALARLVDLNAFRDKVLHGLEKPAVCPFHWQSPECPPDLAGPAFDPRAGRAALAAAGFHPGEGGRLVNAQGQALSFTVLYASSQPYFDRVALYLQEAWRKEGVAVELERADWAAYLKRVGAHEYDAMLIQLTGSSPVTDAWALFHSGADGNTAQLSDPELDALLEKARAADGEPERLRAGQAVARRVTALQPWMFLDLRPDLTAVSRDFRGARASLAWWHFEEWWRAHP
jgi:peptide/nickel transport system substrate-binding protein